MKYFSALFVFILILFTSQNIHADSIAQVILAKGTVTAQSHDGEIRPLKRRSKIYSGDSITTESKSSVQIRFVDKALMTIKANSQFNISEYHLANDTDTQKNKAFMKLIKGGFRTITGSIGKGDKKAYKVDTPAASIGIRGTNYEVQQEKTGDIVVAVYSGGVRVYNSAGSINLGFASDYNFTRVTKDKPPKGLLIPPLSLADNSTAPSESGKTKKKEKNSEEQRSEGDTHDENNNSQNAINNSNQSDDSTLASSLNNHPENITPDESAPMEPYDHSPIEPLASDDTLPDPIELPDEFMPEPTETPSDLSLFDFSDPYNGITAIASPMPSVLSDLNYALAESGQLAFMSLPLFYSQSAGEHPDISSPELSLTSPQSVNSFNAYDYSNDPINIKVCYQIMNADTGAITTYEQQISVNINVTSMADLQAHISDALINGGVEINGVLSANPGLISLALHPSGKRLVFSSTSASNEVVTELQMKFENYGNGTVQALMAQMGSPDALPKDWLAQSSVSLHIGNAAWDTDTNSPLLQLKSQVSENGETLDRTEVFYKPVTADETVNNLNSFFDCTNDNKVCDIQVDQVAAAENIRWGAWLAEPLDKIQIHQQDTDSSGNVSNDTDHGDNMLLFWVAAERADINQLSGSASFSGSANCSDFSQCMGVADDGMVQSINGQFDVNFNNGNITNGQLSVNTAAADSSIYSGGPLSTWQVNFSGQMTAGQPEFVSNSLTGSVSEGGQQVSNQVIGNVGGIFVKPGDVFAGGYNLGTKGDSGKHTAGVFTLDKQP